MIYDLKTSPLYLNKKTSCEILKYLHQQMVWGNFIPLTSDGKTEVEVFRHMSWPRGIGETGAGLTTLHDI